MRLSEKAKSEVLKNEEVMNKTALSVVAKTKKNNSYLAITDKRCKIKKLPPKIYKFYPTVFFSF